MQAALSHFQAMIAGDPRLAGELGNEQIKMRAVLQVLQVRGAEPSVHLCHIQHLLQQFELQLC